MPLSVPPPSLHGLSAPASRRALLKAAGLGGLVLVGGAWMYRALRAFGPPAPGMVVLDTREADIVQKISMACFAGPPEWPLSADEAQVTRFVDLYVSELYADTQGLFRTLIRAVDLSSLPTRGRPIRSLERTECLKAWHAWRDSTIAVRRAGYQSLTFAMNLGYFEDDRVRAAGGFTRGCDLSSGPARPDLWSMRAKKTT